MRVKKLPRGAAVVARLNTEPPSRGMNRTEERFAKYLELCKQAGEIFWWDFEAMSFKISSKTRYTPDFSVIFSDGSMTHYETKATWRHKKTKKPIFGWQTASRVRFHSAATLYPFFGWRAARPGLRALGEPEWVEYDPSE